MAEARPPSCMELPMTDHRDAAQLRVRSVSTTHTVYVASTRMRSIHTSHAAPLALIGRRRWHRGTVISQTAPHELGDDPFTARVAQSALDYDQKTFSQFEIDSVVNVRKLLVFALLECS